MKYCVIFVMVIKSIQIATCGFPNYYMKYRQESITGDPGEPLFLTPLIEQNEIKTAQTAAKVSFDEFRDITSYSGYLTVDKEFNSNLFFWFFPALTDYEKAPVILWLQGGPGASSLIGLFGEHGPFIVKNIDSLELRKFAWTSTHSVIYIDNPVGTGYSFTNYGYAENQTIVGEHLYNALVQFFTLFPELQKNDLFISGESYAGKYVPAVSYTIMKKNPTAKFEINLQGLAIGNGFSDPEHQLKYSNYLYQIGLIDANALDTFLAYEEIGMKFINTKQYAEAYILFDSLLDGSLMENKTSFFKTVTGFDNYYNYLNPIDPFSQVEDLTAQYLQRSDVRAAIHVGNSTFNVEDNSAEMYLMGDIMQPITPWISELLNKYRILMYSGQLDIIMAYPLTENFLQNLNFAGAEEYKSAPRIKWYVGKDLAGYVKQAGKLTEVLVRNAGHMVPADQPQWAFDLITRFTRNEPFNITNTI